MRLAAFDTIMVGNILQHLQDPVGAVLQVVGRTDHLIITEADWLPGIGDDLPCMVMYHLPHPFSPYQVKPKLLQTLLLRWGFTDQTLTWHTQVMLRMPSFDEQGRVSWVEFAQCRPGTTHSGRAARRDVGESGLGGGCDHGVFTSDRRSLSRSPDPSGNTT